MSDIEWTKVPIPEGLAATCFCFCDGVLLIACEGEVQETKAEINPKHLDWSKDA